MYQVYIVVIQKKIPFIVSNIVSLNSHDTYEFQNYSSDQDENKTKSDICKINLIC